jgi:hypothetical protein
VSSGKARSTDRHFEGKGRAQRRNRTADTGIFKRVTSRWWTSTGYGALVGYFMSRPS